MDWSETVGIKNCLLNLTAEHYRGREKKQEYTQTKVQKTEGNLSKEHT